MMRRPDVSGSEKAIPARPSLLVPLFAAPLAHGHHMALNANFHNMVPAVLAPTSSAMKRVLARKAKELAQAQREEEVGDAEDGGDERWKKEKRQLYSKDGEPLPLFGGPYGIAYDEHGLPVEDIDIEEDEDGLGTKGSDGRRRGARVVGRVSAKDYAHLVKRTFPDWGKRFGLVKKPEVGYFGAFSLDEAQLCLTTEDFGFKIPDDEAALAPFPPLVRLCYGELHGEEPESIRLFTGESEIHLLRDLELAAAHAMLQRLGYVCYNHPGTAEPERWWGEGVDLFPQKSGAGLPGGKGPTFYSWFYRLPPWMPGLVLEGEEGDPISGPIALKRKAAEEQSNRERECEIERGLLALKEKISAQRELSKPTAAEPLAEPEDEEKE